MNKGNEVVDITIIGGGPVGMFTAFYAGMRQASVKIIESLPQLGGQLAALYPDKYVYDIAGFPEVKARDLVEQLQAQMDQFEQEVCLNQEVIEVIKEDDVFKIVTSTDVHYSKTIIITAGNGAFKPRMLNLDQEEKLAGTNLHYSVQDINDFAGRDVCIFGGGDSAVDWALMLEKVANSVSIVHRRDRFRAHEHSVQQLHGGSINVLTPYVPTEIIGDTKVDGIVLRQTKTKEEIVVKADDYIVNYGFISNLGPINNWGLAIDKQLIAVNSSAETNIPGIYAVGDISTYPGKVALMATGFGEAPIAVSNAKIFINPEESVHVAHSTSIMSRKLNKEKKEAVTN